LKIVPFFEILIPCGKGTIAMAAPDSPGVVQTTITDTLADRAHSPPPGTDTDSYRPSTTPEGTVDLRGVLAPPQAAGEIGRLGHYAILKQLGRGGMGLVLLAQDSNLQRLTALKIMLPVHAQNPLARERFLREARAAAKIKHDNVVTIFQVGEERGVPYIAMELLEGFSLEDYLEKKGELTISEVIRVARESAEGLRAAHAAGLVHRDIKPANIWLEAPLGRVKILDFGLAREEVANDRMTQSGAVIGTPKYMSPEQADGKPVDARSDLFSLGVVIYRLCAGREPFSGPSMLAVLKAVMFDPPAPVRQLNPQVPAALAALIERLLAKKFEDRVQSAADLIAALTAINSGPPGPATTRLDMQPVADGARAPEKRVATDDTPVATKPLMAPATVVGIPEASTRTEHPHSLVRKRWPWRIAAPALVVLLIAAFIAIPGKHKTDEPGQKTEGPPTTSALGVSSSTNPALLRRMDEKLQRDLDYLRYDLGNGVDLWLVKVAAAGKSLTVAGADSETATIPLNKDFYIGKFEVTRGQFRRFVDAAKYETDAERGAGGRGYDEAVDQIIGPNKDFSWLNANLVQDYSHPVVNVSWNDANKFCEWLSGFKSEQLGIEAVRLPHEVEWEFACRAGSPVAWPFSFGPRAGAYEKANFKPEAGAGKKAPAGSRGTKPCGSYPPNEFGLYDMHGNVMEWCRDWVDEDFAQLASQKISNDNPLQNKDKFGWKVLRGGSWNTLPERGESGYRQDNMSPDLTSADVGFRVVVILK
jgi:serine/threonine protein kinase/formylglycine-generating enzyme required for sulfatase activity